MDACALRGNNDRYAGMSLGDYSFRLHASNTDWTTRIATASLTGINDAVTLLQGRVTPSADSFEAWRNGVALSLTLTGTAQTSVSLSSAVSQYYHSSTSATIVSRFWTRALSDAELMSVRDNYWIGFKPRRIYIPNAIPVTEPRPVYIRRPWTKQPPSPAKVNLDGSGLFNHLVEATLVTSYGFLNGEGMLASKAEATTALSSVPSTSGLARKFPGGVFTSQLEQAPVRLLSYTTPPAFTLYARLKIDTSVASENPSSWVYARMLYSVGNFGFCTTGQLVGVFQGGGFRGTTGAAITPGREYDAFLTHPGGTAGATMTVVGFGQTAATATTNLSAENASYVRIGHNVATSTPGAGGVIVGAAWTRVLSPLEMQSVSSNPWQLFQSKRIYIPGSYTVKSGIFALSNARYVLGSLTSTGVTPRFTVTEG